MSKMQSLAFEDVKNCLLERILRILDDEKLGEVEASLSGTNGGATLIHQAIMKAVCFSQQWVRTVGDSSGLGLKN